MITKRLTEDPAFVQNLDFKKNLDFPEIEYECRYKRAIETMASRKLDALLVTNEENLRYFSGFKSGMWLTGSEWPYVALLPANKALEPTLIIPEFMEGTARSSSWISKIMWPKRGPSFGDVMETLVQAIKNNGLDHGKIGMELSDKDTMALSYQRFCFLKEQLPHVKFVDGREAIYDVRKIKSASEIEAIKIAFEITWNAVQAGFSKIKPGMTEKELYKIIAGSMVSNGSEANLFFSITSGTSGFCLADPFPSNYSFDKGMLFLVDCGARYKGYFADFARMCCLGELNDHQKEFSDAIIEANITAARSIKPGVKVSEPLKVSDLIIEKHGLSQYRLWDLIGHGLGMSIHEPPYLTVASYGSTGQECFELGMVINIESSIANVGAWEQGRFAIEDTYIVTEHGSKWISEASPEVWIA